MLVNECEAGCSEAVNCCVVAAAAVLKSRVDKFAYTYILAKISPQVKRLQEHPDTGPAPPPRRELRCRP